MTGRSFIDIRGLEVAYGKQRVLQGIDLQMEQGSFTALLGASGCGKTTLLRTLCGFNQASAGDITVAGHSVLALPPESRGMAMVFQSYALWPHMTVAQNIGYGLKLRGEKRDAIANKIATLLTMLDMAGFENRRVTELSGGQRQRVALGRALAIDPQILLLDEPLSNLDARIRLQMRHEIRSLQQKLGLTAILVTHDREEAMAMADRIVILHEGRIAQTGTAEDVFLRPASPYVAAFMGAENIIHCRIEHAGEHLKLALNHDNHAEFAPHAVREIHLAGKPAQEAQIHFRSEAAFLHPPHSRVNDTLQLPGKIRTSSFLGNNYRCEIETRYGNFLIDHPQRPDHDQHISICIPARSLLVYQRETPPTVATSHA